MNGEVPNAIAIAPGLAVPNTLLEFSYTRSGGPGGQNVNKLNTKAVLTVSLADLEPHLGSYTIRRLQRLAGVRADADGRLRITSDESRSQQANRRNCIEKLRRLILRARARPKLRKATKPTRAARERRLEGKRRRSQIKRRRSGRDFGYD